MNADTHTQVQQDRLRIPVGTGFARAHEYVGILWTIFASLVLVAPPVSTAGAQPTPPPVQDKQASHTWLLDEVPDYAQLLATQWSSRVPPLEPALAADLDHYGRLFEDHEPVQLSLAECIALAIQNNTELKIQRLDPAAATVGVRSARSIFEPQLFGEVNKERTNTPNSSINFLTGGTTETFTGNVGFTAGVRKRSVTGGLLSLTWTNHRFNTVPSFINLVLPRYTTSLALTLNQPLLRGFGWRHSLLVVDIAQTAEEQARYAYEARLSHLVSRVESAYWSLVDAIEGVKVQEQGLELARELLRQNEGKYNVGTLPRTAVLEAQAEVARREANLIRARNQATVARDTLRALLNVKREGSSSLLLLEPLDEPQVTSYPIDLQRSLELARQRRPELMAARLGIRGKQLSEKLAQNRLLPRLDFVGAVGLNGLGGHRADVPASAPPDPEVTPDPRVSVPNPAVLGGYERSLELLTDGRYYNYFAGAVLEIPLGNSAAKADVALARIDTQRAALNLQQVEEAVTLEIKQAINTLEADLKSIEATRIARALAEENLRNQQARYDVGLATTKDLLDFQDRLTQARSAEIRALIQYNIDLALLRRFEGTLLEARNVVFRLLAPEKAPWWARF